MTSSPLVIVALLLAAGDSPMPDPKLGPEKVVQIQVDAMREVDKPSKDAGLAIVFRFASTGNRAQTGPLERFAGVVKAPGYAPMLNHRIAGYGPMIVVGDVAAQRVTFVAADGRAFEYEFRLSKDPKSKCWGTDAVLPVIATPIKPVGPITRLESILRGESPT